METNNFRSKSTSSSKTSHEDDVMSTLRNLEEQHKWDCANADLKFWQSQLEQKLGTPSKFKLKNHQRLAALPKLRKTWCEKAKDMRKHTDETAKAMKADVIDRYNREMAFTVPTVRTALRIHDDLDIDEQMATTTDENGPLSLGTSTAFIDTILKLDWLRGEAQENKKIRSIADKREAARKATLEYYDQFKVVEEVVEVDPNKPKEWTEEEKASMARPLTVATGRFDRWLDRRIVKRLDCECISPGAALRQSRSESSRDFLNTR